MSAGELQEQPLSYPLEGLLPENSSIASAVLGNRMAGMSQMAFTGYLHKGAPIGLKGLLGGARPGSSTGPLGRNLGFAAIGYHVGGPLGGVIGFGLSGMTNKGLLEPLLGADKAKELAWGLDATGAQVQYGVSEAATKIVRSGSYRPVGTQASGAKGLVQRMGQGVRRGASRVGNFLRGRSAGFKIQTHAYDEAAEIMALRPSLLNNLTNDTKWVKYGMDESYYGFRNRVAVDTARNTLESSQAAITQNSLNIPLRFTRKETHKLAKSRSTSSVRGMDRGARFRAKNSRLRHLLSDQSLAVSPTDIRTMKDLKPVQNRIGLMQLRLTEGAAATGFDQLTQFVKVNSKVPKSFVGQLTYGLRRKAQSGYQHELEGVYNLFFKRRGGIRDTSMTANELLDPAATVRKRLSAPGNAGKTYKTQQLLDASSRQLDALKDVGFTGEKVTQFEHQLKLAKEAAAKHGAHSSAARQQLLKARGAGRKASQIASKSMAGYESFKTTTMTIGSAVARSAKWTFGLQVGAELLNATLRGAWNTVQKARVGIDRLSLLEFGSGTALTTQGATSERQRALQVIQSNHMDASSFLGMEAKTIAGGR